MSKRIKIGLFTFYSYAIEETAFPTIIFLILLTVELLCFLIPIYILSILEAPKEWLLWPVKTITYAHNLLTLSGENSHFLIWGLICIFGLLFLCISTIIWYSINSKDHGTAQGQTWSKIWETFTILLFYVLLFIEKTFLIWGFGLISAFLGHTQYIEVIENGSSWKIEITEEEIVDHFSIEHFFMAGFAIFTLCLFVLLCIITLLLGKNPKPDSATAWTYQNISNSLIKLMLKIYVISTILWDIGYTNYFFRICPPLLLLFMLVIYKFIYPPNQQNIVAYINTSGEIILLINYLGAFFGSFLGLFSFYNIILTTCLGLIMSGTSIFLYSFRKKNILRNGMLTYKSPGLCYEVILMLIQTLYKEDKSKILNIFCEMAFLHSSQCSNPTCVSREVLTTFSDVEKVNAFKTYFNKRAKYSSISAFFIQRSEIPENMKHCISDSVAHKFVEYLFVLMIGKYPRNIQLKMLLAYFDLYIVGHSFAALKELSSAENYRPSIRYQFEIFHLRKMIEGFHYRGYFKAKKQMSEYIDTMKIIQFNATYNSCLSMMAQISDISIRFWSLLLEENISIRQVTKLGAEIIHRKRLVNKESKALMGDFGYNLHFLYKLMVFQQKIIHNEQLTFELIRKIKILSENSKLQKTNKILTSTSKQILITVSGERADLGMITGVTEDVDFLLEYSKNDLINKNISTLMSPMLAINHTKYMENFLNTMEFKLLNSSYTTYIKKKSGFYIPIQMISKIQPFFESNEFQFYGILKEIKPILKIGITKLSLNRSPMVFLCDQNNNIFGINEACSEYLKLTMSITEQSFSLKDIFPHFRDDAFEEKLLRDEGIIYSFDPRCLPRDVILGRVHLASEQKKILLWGKLEEVRAGVVDTGVVIMKILTVCWIYDKHELTKINSISDGKYKKRSDKKLEKLLSRESTKMPIFEEMESQLASSVTNDDLSSSCTSISQRKYVLNFKKNRDMHHYTNFLVNFKRYVIISVFLLLILNVIGFFIIREKMENSENNLNIILESAKRMEHTIMLNNQILDVVVCFTFLYETKDEEFINNFYSQRRTTMLPEIDDLKTAQGAIEKIQGKVPDEIQDIENAYHPLKMMNSYDVIESTSFRLSTYIEFLIGHFVELMITRIIYGVVEECRGMKYEYGCKYLRDLYYIYMNIYEEMRVALDDGLTDYISTYLAASLNEEITVLLLVGSGMLFTIISCVVIIMQTIIVAKRKSKLTSTFAYIENNKIILILDNIYYLDMNVIWYHYDFMNKLDEILTLNEVRCPGEGEGINEDEDINIEEDENLDTRKLQSEESKEGWGLEDFMHSPISPSWSPSLAYSALSPSVHLSESCFPVELEKVGRKIVPDKSTFAKEREIPHELTSEVKGRKRGQTFSSQIIHKKIHSLSSKEIGNDNSSLRIYHTPRNIHSEEGSSDTPSPVTADIPNKKIISTKNNIDFDLEELKNKTRRMQLYRLGSDECSKSVNSSQISEKLPEIERRKKSQIEEGKISMLNSKNDGKDKIEIDDIKEDIELNIDNSDESPEESIDKIKLQELENIRCKKKESSILRIDKSLIKEILIKILMAGVLWLIFFSLHITLITTFYKTFETSSDIFKSLARRRSYLSTMNHMVWIALVLNETKDIVDENKDIFSFNYYVEHSLQYEKDLTDTEKDDLSALSKFIELAIDLNTKKYIYILEQETEYNKNNVDNYSCKSGHNGITSKGLKNSIHGYINTIIKFRDTVVESNRSTNQLMLNWLDEGHFGSYLFVIHCITPAITRLIEVFMDEIGNYFDHSLMLELLHLLGIFFLSAIIYFILLAKIIIKLQKELCLTEEMLNLIPLQIVLENEKLLRQFIPNKNKFNEKLR